MRWLLRRTCMGGREERVPGCRSHFKNERKRRWPLLEREGEEEGERCVSAGGRRDRTSPFLLEGRFFQPGNRERFEGKMRFIRKVLFESFAFPGQRCLEARRDSSNW